MHFVSAIVPALLASTAVAQYAYSDEDFVNDLAIRAFEDGYNNQLAVRAAEDEFYDQLAIRDYEDEEFHSLMAREADPDFHQTVQNAMAGAKAWGQKKANQAYDAVDEYSTHTGSQKAQAAGKVVGGGIGHAAGHLAGFAADTHTFGVGTLVGPPIGKAIGKIPGQGVGALLAKGAQQFIKHKPSTPYPQAQGGIGPSGETQRAVHAFD